MFFFFRRVFSAIPPTNLQYAHAAAVWVLRVSVGDAREPGKQGGRISSIKLVCVMYVLLHQILSKDGHLCPKKRTKSASKRSIRCAHTTTRGGARVVSGIQGERVGRSRLSVSTRQNRRHGYVAKRKTKYIYTKYACTRHLGTTQHTKVGAIIYNAPPNDNKNKQNFRAVRAHGIA